jgi:hypothetical protein
MDVRRGTNTWTQRHPSGEPIVADDARLVYDVDSDLTIGVVDGTIWTYDLKADAWTQMGVAPTDSIRWAYDPASGFAIAASTVPASDTRPLEFWSYDVAADAWTPIRQAGPAPRPDVGASFAYDATVDRLIVYALGYDRSETWLLDLRAGVWTRSTVDAPMVNGIWGMALFPPAIVHDEAAGRTMISGGTGRSAAYDAVADRWEILSGSLRPEQAFFAFGPMTRWSLDAYDSVNGRLVGGGDAGSVWAFDPSTRQWIVLLEANAAETAPTADGPEPAATPALAAPELEAILPSKVNGVSFAKTSVAGGIPPTRLGKGGWATVPLGSDEDVEQVLSIYTKTRSDLDVAVATPTDVSRADTFIVAYQVKGLDMTGFATDLAGLSGIGPGDPSTVSGKQLQVFREVGGMGFDLYVRGDVLFYIFTDGTPLIDEVVAALP